MNQIIKKKKKNLMMESCKFEHQNSFLNFNGWGICGGTSKNFEDPKSVKTTLTDTLRTRASKTKINKYSLN